MENVIVQSIISGLELYYIEEQRGRTLEYDYGFFDAIAAIRDLGWTSNARADMKIMGFIRSVLDDPAQRARLLALLEQEGFHVAGLSEEREDSR